MESIKNCRDNNTESNVEEEMEMEQFYELMRAMKSKLHRLQENNKRKRATVAGPGGWVPVFEWEDFTTEIEFKKHDPSSINVDNRKKEGKSRVGSTSGLNLELNL